MIGPFPDPITGVSLANKVAKELLEKEPSVRVSDINTSYNKFDEDVGGFSLNKLFFYLKFNFQLYKVFGKNILYITPGQTFFGVTKYLLFVTLANKLGKEVVVHINGNHMGREYASLEGFKKRLFYYVMSKATKGIVLSRSLKNNLSPFLSEEKIFLLNNFAEDYLMETTDKSGSETLKMVYLSNLMQEKGILVFLDALLKLEEGNIHYSAKIAGNIDSKNEKIIREKFDRLKNTEYIGVVGGTEKRDLLAWSNIFVLPTFYQMEGQPLSILEAMATGNVIVTTKHAGIPDILKEQENGYFAKKNDVASLFEIFRKIENDKSVIEKIKTTNKMYFLETFTTKIFANKLMLIFKS